MVITMAKQAEDRLCRVRERLINSAIALAPTPNFSELTLDDIAHAYGITSAEARNCFANADELVNATRDYLSATLPQNIDFPTAPDFAGAVKELVMDYAKCARSNTQFYRAMYSLLPAAPIATSDNPNPVAALVSRVIEQFAPDAPEWLRMTRTFAIFACMHGYTHLCTVGSLRHLSTSAKDFLADALGQHLVSGIHDSLETCRSLSVAPYEFFELVDAVSTEPAKDLPRGTDAERLAALFRSSVEVIAHQGRRLLP
ncbi:hypothetical protein CKALI_03305 [Corynebacterium kalinowskii]|uniref:TetR/AcrR family transcriptional regulator n=2 Tax=Corynebacterium kalinowskii TaxID=2675216 RepID=A0A6B8VJ94_9CORY|nr:hypothetical protein CKALI_03305 [Corynebacterium kalinowskii]